MNKKSKLIRKLEGFKAFDGTKATPESVLLMLDLYDKPEFIPSNYGLIYALNEPETLEMRYIGKTFYFRHRILEHYQGDKNIANKYKFRTRKECWVEGLKNKGFLCFIPSVYGLFPSFELNKQEKRAILDCIDRGCPLTNNETFIPKLLKYKCHHSRPISVDDKTRNENLAFLLQFWFRFVLKDAKIRKFNIGHKPITSITISEGWLETQEKMNPNKTKEEIKNECIELAIQKLRDKGEIVNVIAP